MDTQNQYGAYVIFSKESMKYADMFECVRLTLNLSPEEPLQDKIVLLRKCLSKEVEDTKRWHLCLKKEYIEQVRKYGEESDKFKIVSYRPNNKPIGPGKTYAFYIPYTSEDSKREILSYIKILDGTFIRPGSYKIHHPLPREDGSDRGYMLMSFEKNGEFYPRPFIRTLRALLNDLPGWKELINVKWCSHRVLRDVTSGVTK
jgi:hypothetical protein